MENVIKKKKECYFCVNNIKDIDYKDTQTLRKFINAYCKILPKKRTGTCAKPQRKLAQAIKRSRIIALIPFVKFKACLFKKARLQCQCEYFLQAKFPSLSDAAEDEFATYPLT